MEKKFRADNGGGNLYWGIVFIFLFGFLLYEIWRRESIWIHFIYLAIVLVSILSVTIREYVITELNFLEVRYVLKLKPKNRRIAIGDMVGIKKLKKNQLRIDKVRGFEVLRVKESDMDALIAELKDRNPRIRIAGEEE